MIQLVEQRQTTLPEHFHYVARVRHRRNDRCRVRFGFVSDRPTRLPIPSTSRQQLTSNLSLGRALLSTLRLHEKARTGRALVSL